ncbi:HAD hydrolase family protein [Streptococcus didelphis]|uniref:HAD family hydrolase n=1 Tax=Streptococcus didelphis TaxID=102886 RepID=UPI001FDF4A39|nr:HAD hydrolase family protein [Streptococcus didelphis]WMB30134.1 HAD hydrolase family protein [Streptococcus didelphis]WMB30205.1 HAD hydrolase family protein [Streptococcus didelphis]
MTAEKVDKGRGLARLCKYLDIEISQAIAVGDADNDESMIRMAGLGIAMGNANQHIMRLADVVVETNDKAGISQALDYFY